MPEQKRTLINRRDFIKTSLAGATALSVLRPDLLSGAAPAGRTAVVLVKTLDRTQGVKDALKLLSFPSPKGKSVVIKPNFNTADPAPGSTHNDTLRQIVLEMKARGAGRLTLAERSGPPATAKVMEEKGIPALADELKFEIVNFETLGPDGWKHFQPDGSHWKNGFDIAKPIADAEYLVSTCCLKTHRWGTITMSLKLAVGTTPKTLMREMHGSPDIRLMIAELNLGFKPQVIIMDGVNAFVDGGPSTGKMVEAGVVIAGTDRVAVDAVGVAVLKELGSNETIMGRKIFEQDQIKRAVELGLGAAGPDAIEIVAGDKAGRDYADRIRAILKQG
jgi:uncharacterized protein (DUF362 family)